MIVNTIYVIIFLSTVALLIFNRKKKKDLISTKLKEMNLTNSMILLGKKSRYLFTTSMGVMTDNRAMIFNNGDESVLINRSDGLAIEKIKSFGIDQIIISTETNDIVMKRAEKLGIFAVSDCKKQIRGIK